MKTVENTQSISLDLRGNIISSDSTLFDPKKLSSNCVLDWSPFVESIFPSLLKAKEAETFLFEKIKTIHHFLDGYYDYTFSKKGDKVVWTIFDYTTYYLDQIKNQQFHHECVIFKQVNNLENNRSVA